MYFPWRESDRSRLTAAESLSPSSSARSRTRDHHAFASPSLISPVNSCSHVWHFHHHSALLFCSTSASAARTRQPRWARPVAPRHAHPDWISDGLMSKQMKHTPSLPWLTSSPRATFISAPAQKPAALLKLLQSSQSSLSLSLSPSLRIQLRAKGSFIGQAYNGIIWIKKQEGHPSLFRLLPVRLCDYANCRKPLHKCARASPTAPRTQAPGVRSITPCLCTEQASCPRDMQA